MRRFPRHRAAIRFLWIPAMLMFVAGSFAAAPDVASVVTQSGEAASLVQAALDAEQAGNSASRTALLDQAIMADPDYAPARWHRGQVKFDGKWRSLAEIQTLVTTDRRWTGYRELRESLDETPEGHLTLAEYCRDNKLADEARFHWANVLLAWPTNETARKQLSLVRYRGGLLTREQVADMERAANNAQKNLERFRPQFAALTRDAIGSDPTKRDAALEALAAVADPAALEALEQAVNKAAAKAPQHTVELHGALVSAFANMPQHEATLRLLNYAVLCDTASLRAQAALALRPRPQTDYVPILMSALTAPIDVEVDVLALPDGTVRMLQTIRQAGAETNRVQLRSVNFETEGALRNDRTISDHGDVLDRHLGRAEAIAATTEARAEAANAAAEARNERIKEVLIIAAGLSAEDDAEESWADWKAVNELHYAEASTQVTYSDTTRVYAYPQARVMYPREGRVERRPEGQGSVARSPEPAWRNPAQPRQFLTNYDQESGGRRHSCFVPGTPVWTPEGPRPIEQLEIGDLVLAQNPGTGELAYRAVLLTTTGDPSSVWQIRLAKESIGTTSGHRFWVNGRGWAMAKTLEPCMRLHSLDGPVEVEAILESEKVQCHNLVVDEFHTYFVGKSKLLVHDKGCPLPVVSSVPGSATVRNLPTLDPPLAILKSGW
jgi:hypothetical protein